MLLRKLIKGEKLALDDGSIDQFGQHNKEKEA
jgi:hypothetical protein